VPRKDELVRLEEQIPDHKNCIRLIGVLDKGVWSIENEQWIGKMDSVSVHNGIGIFLSLLNRLENTAQSRGEYRLQDWFS
jgi:hypothetical protein